MIGKSSKKTLAISYNILYTKEKKCFQLMFQIITQPVKKQ